MRQERTRNFMDTQSMYEVQLFREGKYVTSFWCRDEDGVAELRHAFELENETLKVFPPVAKVDGKPWSPYDGMTEEEKRQAHNAQVRQMMRDGV